MVVFLCCSCCCVVVGRSCVVVLLLLLSWLIVVVVVVVLFLCFVVDCCCCCCCCVVSLWRCVSVCPSNYARVCPSVLQIKPVLCPVSAEGLKCARSSARRLAGDCVKVDCSMCVLPL